MKKSKVICIVGRNASGKTALAERLRRQWASDSVRYVSFDDAYGSATDKTFYLQLRWNQHDIDNETPTVGQLLERTFLLTGPDDNRRRTMQKELYALFGLDLLLDKYIILLSSGELRKYQLAKTLMAEPATLILDNPFIGLDATTRDTVRQLLGRLSTERSINVYLILAKSDEVPPFADEVMLMEDGTTEPRILSPSTFLQALPPTPSHVLTDAKRQAIISLPHRTDDYEAPTVVEMRNVSIRYGQRTILSNLNWTIAQGDRWALSGQNGSGKSTLLSLICADNPQAYACDISLFGRQRGSGETIWDIKRHIGYVSPEMHRSYRRPLPALHVVASGLKDTVGLYVRPTKAERQTCLWWMDIFGIKPLADRLFTSLSSGEQRLVLLARAFVKDPQLIVLDEPLHGLDNNHRQMVRDIIDTFCQRPHKTLIIVTHYDGELPSCINKRITLSKHT